MARLAYLKKRQRLDAATQIDRLGANSPINHIRKAVFGSIEVQEKGRLKKRLFIDVYFAKVAEDAARGVLSAVRQQTWLIGFLIDKSILHEPEAEDPDVVAARRRLARDPLLCERAHRQAAQICHAILPEVQRAYQAHRPDSAPIRTLVPFEWKAEFDAFGPAVEPPPRGRRRRSGVGPGDRRSATAGRRSIRAGSPARAATRRARRAPRAIRGRPTARP